MGFHSLFLHPDDTMNLSDLTILPLILYVIWQVGYLLATEVLLAEKIRKDLTIVTSLIKVSNE